MSRAPALLCLFLAGCGQNAILELTLDLPPSVTVDMEQIRFANVQPRTDANPFAEEWPPDDLPALELGATPIEDQVSVVTADTELDVHLKVRFCRVESCTAFGDESGPEVWYLLEHPFYEGKRTSYHVTIDAIPAGRPTEPTTVDRCQIEGCLSGTSTTFCTSDGRHVCED